MTGMTRRSAGAIALAAPWLGRGASAQGGWPGSAGTIRLVVPFPAGGGVDAVARLVQPGLQQRLGARVIVDNQPGGSGSVATARVARAARDGTNWLFVYDSHAVNPALQPLGFDTAKDLEPVMLIGTAPNVLAAHPAKPYRALADVVAAAKARPETVTFGSVGNGSLGHLAMVRLGQAAGVKLTHVPYRGGRPALNDALAGHVELLIASTALVNPQLEGKSLVPIAQFGAERAASPELKDVPTAKESGFPGLEAVTWFGVFAPGRTPAAMVARFGAELEASLTEERVRSTMAEMQSLEILAAGPAELQRFLERQMDIWGAVVRENEIKADS